MSFKREKKTFFNLCLLLICSFTPFFLGAADIKGSGCVGKLDEVPLPSSTYTVGGNITGQTGTVTLQNNQEIIKVQIGEKSFIFPTPLLDGESYEVSVVTSPEGQTCIIDGGDSSGQITGSNIDNIQVLCSDNLFSVNGSLTSGSISLGESVTLILKIDNTTQDSETPDSQNPSYSFGNLENGTAFELQITNVPDEKTCVFDASASDTYSGQIQGANLNSIDISCNGPSLFIISSIQDTSGDMFGFGGKPGAHFLCDFANAGQYDHALPFMSFTNIDEIADMPSTNSVPVHRPILSQSNVRIAGNWAALLNGSIESSLADAGVLNANSYWYSGSTADGSVTDDVCYSPIYLDAWTDPTATSNGSVGSSTLTNSGWINNPAITCDNVIKILCLVWDD